MNLAIKTCVFDTKAVHLDVCFWYFHYLPQALFCWMKQR